VVELLEGVAVPQPDLDLQEFKDYLVYEVQTDVQLPPASKPKPSRSATERVKDGFRNVKRHRQQQRAKIGASQRPPRLIPLTKCVAYVSFFISAMAALTSYGAYSTADATRGMDAMAAELRADAALSICVSSGCAGILVLGWAFLLQMVWEIHQSTVGD